MSFDDVDISRLRRSRGEKWTRYPEDVLPAWVADMDFQVAPPIADYMQRAVADNDFGYPVNPNLRGLSHVFANRARQRWNWEIEPRMVEVMTDVVQGMYVGMSTLTEPGDGAVIQRPVYRPIQNCVAELGRRPVHNDLLDVDGRYEIDFDGLRRVIDSNTRVLMLCNPQNPTGRIFTGAELQELAEIAIERDLIVFADEIHADLVHPGQEHVPIATLGADIASRTITFTSATKAFNIAGTRTAVAIFGSDDLKKRFQSIPRHVRGGLGIFGLNATRIAWEECDQWLDEVQHYIQANAEFIAEFVHEQMPSVRFRPPDASYLAWLDCRELELPSEPFDFFLEKARVALSAGTDFGPGGSGCGRLNFATSRATLTQILERMASSLS